MPVLKPSYHRKPWLFRWGLVNTVVPNVLRNPPQLALTPKLHQTPDKDIFRTFEKLRGNRRIAIIIHGLEGHGKSSYVLGMMGTLHAEKWDVISLEMRSCGGLMNQLYNSYHSGFTKDLEQLIYNLAPNYEEIGVVGFSLGGSVVAKYLSDPAIPKPPSVIGGAGVSTPCDLSDAAKELAKWQNRVYMQRFLMKLKGKLQAKVTQFKPAGITLKTLHAIKNFNQFDDIYTAPAHGFHDRHHYYTSQSSLNYFEALKHPFLLLNAEDDSFLPSSSYPERLADANKYLHLETPPHGGHVGFVDNWSLHGPQWMDRRVANFLSEISTKKG